MYVCFYAYTKGAADYAESAEERRFLVVIYLRSSALSV